MIEIIDSAFASVSGGNTNTDDSFLTYIWSVFGYSSQDDTLYGNYSSQLLCHELAHLEQQI